MLKTISGLPLYLLEPFEKSSLCSFVVQDDGLARMLTEFIAPQVSLCVSQFPCSTAPVGWRSKRLPIRGTSAATTLCCLVGRSMIVSSRVDVQVRAWRATAFEPLLHDFGAEWHISSATGQHD